MKKLAKIAACGLLATLGVTAMTSCGDNSPSLAEEVLNKVILIQEGEKVSEDFVIPRVVKYNSETYEISWTSSDTSVIAILENDDTQYTADVKLPFDADTEVKLTASVTVDGKTAAYDFKTTVEMIDGETALSKAISNSGVKPSYDDRAVIELPTKSNEYKEEITFEYSLGGTYATAKLEGTQLTLEPLETGKETVIIKAKATAGSLVVEKDIKTTVSKEVTFLSVAEALAQPKDALIYVQGRVESIVNETYGNLWIQDDAGNKIEIYGFYQGDIDANYPDGVWNSTDAVRYDKWETKLAVGDYVYAYGKRDTYGTIEEITNCLIQDYPFLSVGEALEVAKGDFLTVYGEVKSIVNETYGNLYLKDADGNELYVYGLYQGDIDANYPDGVWTSTGAVRYDSWETKLAVGDVIAIYGPMDEYNGAKQLKNGLLQVVLKKATTASTEPEPEEPTEPTTPVAPETPLTSATAQHTEAATTNIDKVANPVTALGLNDYVFDVTFTECNGGSYSNQPGLNKDGTIRLYNNTAGEGNTLTFSVIDGYQIDSITITYSTSANWTNKGTLQVYTTPENVLTGDSDTYIVNGNSVTLKNIATVSSHQIWIVQIDFVLSQTA